MTKEGLMDFSLIIFFSALAICLVFQGSWLAGTAFFFMLVSSITTLGSFFLKEKSR
ncbi:hypothetical protein [Bacillus infantis]|jgi:hypothetical protein|uniref:hypothetical protein n=1 Tax=Bacillus infantis TaxID=324767 RepID=UPI002155A8D9|nr:hypothetical protein [Bacillus infantis]MCR6611072.1 hypothetical protein [Bacillus infantis]